MKKTILAIAIFALTSAACQQTATNTANLAPQQGNQAIVANSNSSAANASGMNHTSSDHSSANHGSMNHDSMQSSPNAAAQPYDLQFIDTMAMHHEGAVEMAQMALQKSRNEELKKFAEKIVADQNREIRQMKDWREKWYAGKPEAMNMEMPGMRDSMTMDMPKLSASAGGQFDHLFLEMMIPHHVGAIEMSREALTKAEHPEIKTLAQNIIREQEKEIAQMNDWKARWSK